MYRKSYACRHSRQASKGAIEDPFVESTWILDVRAAHLQNDGGFRRPGPFERAKSIQDPF
jgi:hypothetical protein